MEVNKDGAAKLSTNKSNIGSMFYVNTTTSGEGLPIVGAEPDQIFTHCNRHAHFAL